MTADLATSDAATARLFRERYSELVGLAGLLLDDAGAAEEVVQDAFARFHLSRHRIHDPDREVAYLRSIVCNLARGRIRRWVLERLRLSRGEPVGYEGRPYVEHGDWSWYTGTDVMRCPDGLYGVDDELDAVRAPDGDMGRSTGVRVRSATGRRCTTGGRPSARSRTSRSPRGRGYCGTCGS